MAHPTQRPLATVSLKRLSCPNLAVKTKDNHCNKNNNKKKLHIVKMGPNPPRQKKH